jgi:hypothetical protein
MSLRMTSPAFNLCFTLVLFSLFVPSQMPSKKSSHYELRRLHKDASGCPDSPLTGVASTSPTSATASPTATLPPGAKKPPSYYDDDAPAAELDSRAEGTKRAKERRSLGVTTVPEGKSGRRLSLSAPLLMDKQVECR